MAITVTHKRIGCDHISAQQLANHVVTITDHNGNYCKWQQLVEATGLAAECPSVTE